MSDAIRSAGAIRCAEAPRPGLSPVLIGLMIGLGLVLAAPQRARAVDPGFAITQYAHRAWHVGEAGLQSSPFSGVQGRDGYLWFGATTGLYRFDGVTFREWRDASGAKPDVQEVGRLFVAKDGDVYIGANDGLSRISDGFWKKWSAPLQYPGPFVQDGSGHIWFAHTGQRSDASSLCMIESETLRCFGARDGFQCPDNQTITTDRSGGIWVGGANGFCRRDPEGRIQNYPLPGFFEGHMGMAFGLATTPDGTVWGGVSVPVAGAGSGLMRFQGGRWAAVPIAGDKGEALAVRSMWTDRRGSLWIGTWAHGLYRYFRGRLDHYGVADGLSGNLVVDGFEDREGSVWVVTPHGVDQFRDYALTTYSSGEGLSAEDVESVAAASDGATWIGNLHAIDIIRNGVVAKLDYQGAVSPAPVETLFADSRGGMWIGNRDGLALWTAGRIRRQSDPQGMPLGRVLAAAEDRSHDVWVASLDMRSTPRQGSLVRFHQGSAVEVVSAPAAAGRHAIDQLASDPAGGLWVGVFQHGLFTFDRGSGFRRVSGIDDHATVVGLRPIGPGDVWVATLKGVYWVHGDKVLPLEGLPCRAGRSVILDRAGDLWVGLACGLVRLPAGEISRWMRNPRHAPRGDMLGVDSGYASVLGVGPPALAPDGRIWFIGTHDVRVLDPQRLPFNSMPPGIEIQQVVADRQAIPASLKVTTSKLVRQIEIDYAGLSFVRPDKVSFRIRLLGHDPRWVEVGNRRQAFYNDLPPGQYRFEVIACNDDGVCNPHTASLSLILPPAWWQTLWFKALTTIALIGLVAYLARQRWRRYHEVLRARFDERLRERTRVARDLHDTLLQTVLASKLLTESTKPSSHSQEEIQNTLDRLSLWLGEAVEQGRAAVDALRHSTAPPDNLTEALARAMEECRIGREIQTRLVVNGAPREVCSMRGEEVFRIVAEAIRNACLHADASELRVEIDYGAVFTIKVRDDGRGIDPEILRSGKAGHFGLVGMRERASAIGGSLAVSSSPDGTEILLQIPGPSIYRDLLEQPLWRRWLDAALWRLRASVK